MSIFSLALSHAFGGRGKKSRWGSGEDGRLQIFGDAKPRRYAARWPRLFSLAKGRTTWRAPIADVSTMVRLLEQSRDKSSLQQTVRGPGPLETD